MDDADRFVQAASVLPQRFRDAALALPERIRSSSEELRLRVGYGLSVLCAGKELAVLSGAEAKDLTELAARAAQGSLHSAAESVRQGFITAPGGHRVGLCGTAVVSGGEIVGMRAYTSASIRISKELRGVAEYVYAAIKGDAVRSTLILSRPGAGKTTLLRDLIRMLSGSGLRVGVADERGELAGGGTNGGAFELGSHTDVMAGAPKAAAALMLLRTMSPSVIAMDEITAPEDITAAEKVSNCGVGVYATIHAGNLKEAQERYGHEMLSAIFHRRILIRISPCGQRVYELEDTQK